MDINKVPKHEEGKFLIVVDIYNDVIGSTYWEIDHKFLGYVFLLDYGIEEFRCVRADHIKRMWIVNDEDGPSLNILQEVNYEK